ncbi:MAG: hypothetical protein WEG40_12340 [Candidatus Rokuibacteriota bacterium]
MHRAITRVLVPASLAVGVLAGCAIQDPAYPPTTGAVLGGSTPRVVEYPGGRYQLYGDGSNAAPHYWVWVPAGTTPPPPPALPSTRVVSATEGRYQLYGDGSSSSPHYWVWVPAGATVVAPPPPPRRP